MPTKFSLSLAKRLSTNVNHTVDASTLILTQIVFRHGHRAPDNTLKYPGDPHQNEKYMPFGCSELTLDGRKQCYHFGQKLRERYSKLLGPDYYAGLIDAKSSEYSRARTTLQLVLAGLFPPTENTRINDHLNWQPIPFTYTPIKQDNLIGCAILNMYAHEDSPNFRKTQNSLDVIKCIQNVLKWDVSVHGQCMILYDTIKTQVALGFPVPKWCQEIYPDKLRKEYEDFLRHNFSRKCWLVDGTGGLIQEINKVMIQKISDIRSNNEEIPKMFLYSGHDVNVAGLLGIFKKLDVTKWPGFTSNVSFELHQIGDDFYVKILYQDGHKDVKLLNKEENIETIKVPNCSNTLCKLSDFSNYVQDYFPRSAK